MLAAASAAAPAQPLRGEVQTLSTGHRFTEGPAVGPAGGIYFTDIPAGRILRYDLATGRTEVRVEDSGGANGLYFHRGRLYACEGGRRRVGVYAALDPPGNPRSDAWAETVGGVPFNRPNDLAVDAHGGVYFTDPDFGVRPGPKPPVQGVYYRPAAPGPPEVFCLIDDLERPNGVALSPDGRRLYVQDFGAGRIIVYDVTGPGRLANRRVFADVNDLDAGGGPDGLCVDARGRVYTALYRTGAVVVHDGRGQRLQVVPTSPKTSNCVLDADGAWLYVTADRSLKRIRVSGDPE